MPSITVQTDLPQALLQAVLDELAKAEQQHPSWPVDVIHAAAIVGEESGELTQAALQLVYEGGSEEAVRKEAVQTAAMGLRFLKGYY